MIFIQEKTISGEKMKKEELELVNKLLIVSEEKNLYGNEKELFERLKEKKR